MGLWARAFAAVYDRAMANVENATLAAHRERLLAGVAGRVLELGAGSGANLPFYRDAVTELVLVEPEPAMARRLAPRLRGDRLPAQWVCAAAERLPLETGRFDAVVCTLVLCTVRDPARALAEVHRVLRPGGRIAFMEHVRSDDPGLARRQDLLRRPWSWVGCGCQCNRPTLELVAAAGFTLGEVVHDRQRHVPEIVKPLVVGTATRAP